MQYRHLQVGPSVQWTRTRNGTFTTFELNSHQRHFGLNMDEIQSKHANWKCDDDYIYLLRLRSLMPPKKRPYTCPINEILYFILKSYILPSAGNPLDNTLASESIWPLFFIHRTPKRFSTVFSFGNTHHLKIYRFFFLFSISSRVPANTKFLPVISLIGITKNFRLTRM